MVIRILAVVALSLVSVSAMAGPGGPGPSKPSNGGVRARCSVTASVPASLGGGHSSQPSRVYMSFYGNTEQEAIQNFKENAPFGAIFVNSNCAASLGGSGTSSDIVEND